VASWRFVIGGILNRLCWRKMRPNLPQPISEENEDDNSDDLVDSARSQFWRFKRFIGRERYGSHRRSMGDHISKFTELKETGGLPAPQFGGGTTEGIRFSGLAMKMPNNVVPQRVPKLRRDTPIGP
jgi:hypothetical protein